MASQTTPASVAFCAVPTREPTSCALLTNGHSGLNHSRTTVLPFSDESECSLPSRSGNVKSGAGLPIAAVAAGAGAGAGLLAPGSALAGGSDLTLGLASSLVQAARARTRIS